MTTTTALDSAAFVASLDEATRYELALLSAADRDALVAEEMRLTADAAAERAARTAAADPGLRSWLKARRARA